MRANEKKLKSMRNEDALAALVRALKKKALTVKQIRKVTKFSKPATYRQLAQLERSGFRLQKKRVREGSTGPLSVAYGLVQKGKRR